MSVPALSPDQGWGFKRGDRVTRTSGQRQIGFILTTKGPGLNLPIVVRWELVARIAELEKRIERAEIPDVWWVVKSGDEYLDTPHWRYWTTHQKQAARFNSRDEAERYSWHCNEQKPHPRVVRVRKRATAPIGTGEEG